MGSISQASISISRGWALQPTPPYCSTELIRRLLERIQAQTGLPVGEFRVLPFQSDDLADSGEKIVVSEAGSGAALGLLVISSPVNPGSAERTAENARKTREALGPEIGSVVLVPLAQGSIDGRSYVMWPWHHALSESRLLHLIRRVQLFPHVLRWLRDVARQTRQPIAAAAVESQYASPLRTMAGAELFPVAMREAAGRALGRLQTSAWRPYSTLEHNDFWTGNLLLPRDRQSAQLHARGFIVIDWEGVRLAGYPVFDLVRFAVSARVPRLLLRLELHRLRRILGCQAQDLGGYVLAALGAMAQNLGYFPEHRFRELGIESFDAVAPAAYGSMRSYATVTRRRAS
jgi:hypothetical protein